MHDSRIIRFIQSVNCCNVEQFLREAYTEDYLRFSENYFSITKKPALKLLKQVIIDMIMHVRLEEYGGEVFDVDRKFFEFAQQRLFDYKKSLQECTFNEFVKRREVSEATTL